MKRYSVLIILLTAGLTSFTCPVCEKAQPRILRGITHGTGPENSWDYIIVFVAVIIVLLTLFFSVKWLILPGEKTQQQHIKRLVLNF
ncbi:MAG: hypothetical protein ABIN94_16190 [Ferruginibacter sp.]